MIKWSSGMSYEEEQQFFEESLEVYDKEEKRYNESNFLQRVFSGIRKPKPEQWNETHDNMALSFLTPQEKEQYREAGYSKEDMVAYAKDLIREAAGKNAGKVELNDKEEIKKETIRGSDFIDSIDDQLALSSLTPQEKEQCEKKGLNQEDTVAYAKNLLREAAINKRVIKGETKKGKGVYENREKYDRMAEVFDRDPVHEMMVVLKNKAALRGMSAEDWDASASRTKPEQEDDVSQTHFKWLKNFENAEGPHIAKSARLNRIKDMMLRLEAGKECLDYLNDNKYEIVFEPLNGRHIDPTKKKIVVSPRDDDGQVALEIAENAAYLKHKGDIDYVKADVICFARDASEDLHDTMGLHIWEKFQDYQDFGYLEAPSVFGTELSNPALQLSEFAKCYRYPSNKKSPSQIADENDFSLSARVLPLKGKLYQKRREFQECRIKGEKSEVKGDSNSNYFYNKEWGDARKKYMLHQLRDIPVSEELFQEVTDEERQKLTEEILKYPVWAEARKKRLMYQSGAFEGDNYNLLHPGERSKLKGEGPEFTNLFKESWLIVVGRQLQRHMEPVPAELLKRIYHKDGLPKELRDAVERDETDEERIRRINRFKNQKPKKEEKLHMPPELKQLLIEELTKLKKGGR